MLTKLHCTLGVLLLLFSASLNAQDSWTDDFNAASLGSGWYETSNYSLHQADGMLKVSANKAAMWASFGVNVPTLKIRNNPVVNLQVRTEKALQLSLWLVKGDKNLVLTQPVMASDSFQQVSFDFSGMDNNSNVLDSVKTILLGFNGAALSWAGDVYFDALSAGNAAVKAASVSGLRSQVFYQGTTGHRIFLRGLAHVESLELTGVSSLLENIIFEPVSAEGTSWMTFDCKAGVEGTVPTSLVAHGTDGYADNAIKFKLTVEANNPPVFDVISDVVVPPAKKVLLTIRGIGDGNAAASQDVSITAVSNNLALVENNFSIVHEPGSPYASIAFTPVGTGTGSITIGANDGEPSNNLFSQSFAIEVLESWNNKPTINPVASRELLNNAGEQVVELRGLSDGDNGSQELSLTVVSSNPGLITAPALEYSGGSSAILRFTPLAGQAGFTTITVKVEDNGGATGNNGNQKSEVSFDVETYNPPLTGYVIPFSGSTPNAFADAQPGVRDYWHVEGLGGVQQVTHVKDAGEDVFKVVCKQKFTWTGCWYYTPDMDLTDYPLLSMWVKSDKEIRFHIYFWDESIRNNEDHHLEYTIPANVWTKVNFDFSDARGMLNNAGEKVNAKRITRVLFNYHPNYDWPFTNWDGTVMFKDVRIGDISGITPTYNCTADPVGPRTHFKEATEKSVKLTGLGTGKDKNAIVTVSGRGLLTNLHASPVVNGEATVFYTPSSEGTDTVSVIVSGSPINGKMPVEKILKFAVTVVDAAVAQVISPSLNPDQKYQLFRGLGAKNPSSSLLDLYTGDFGASAIRFGILDDNQIEWENDNADPRVLDRSKLNYDAIDWNYVRELKARGVETFLLTYWSPPAWMKMNLSTNYQQPLAIGWDGTENKAMPELYDEYAENAVAVVKMFKEEAGVDLAAMGLQNEPAFCEPYASAILDPEHFAQLIVVVGKRFEEEGIATKLYMAEQVGVKMTDGPIYSNQSYLDAINANAEAKKYSEVFAVHGYGADGVQPGVPPGSADWISTWNAVNNAGKVRELWMTETEPTFANWNDAFINAANILTAFESGNVSLWTEWAWDGHCINQGRPTQKYWAQSMFRFIRPGAVRIASTSASNDLLITSWKNDAQHGDNFVILLMNKGNQPLVASFSQAELPVDYQVYRCSENVPAFRDGVYAKGQKILLAPRSIVTLVSGLRIEPTLDPVMDQLLMIDAPAQELSLTGISDGNESNEHPVELSYSLSDNFVLRDVSLEYSSPSAAGIFHFAPARRGITEVTLTVKADGISKHSSFIIEVKGYNRPNINPITGPLKYEKGTGTKTIQLSGINDGGDGGQALSLGIEISSSTPAGVAGNLDANYSSPASTGSFSFTPDEVGEAVFTITVNDNGPDTVNSASYNLSLLVFDYYPPTMQQQNDTTLEVNKACAVLLRGVTNGGDDNKLTVLSASSSDESITGVVTTLLSQKKVYMTPLKAGTATITVTLTDNGSAGKNTSTMSFNVTAFVKTAVGDEEVEALKVYPNPAGEKLFIRVPVNFLSVYSIVDDKGAVCRNGVLVNCLTELDISGLKPGNYHLVLDVPGKKRSLNFIRK